MGEGSLAGVVPHVRLSDRAAFVVKKQRPVLEADVALVVEGWLPTGWSDSDLRTLDPLMPTVRAWVAEAAPPGVTGAQRLIRATAQMVVWAQWALGAVDVRTVLHPDNINHWTMSVNAHKTASWQENARGALRVVGRAANPEWPPPPPPTVGRRRVAAPYTQSEEIAFVRASRLVGRANRAARMWIVGGSLGVLPTEVGYKLGDGWLASE